MPQLRWRKLFRFAYKTCLVVPANCHRLTRFPVLCRGVGHPSNSQTILLSQLGGFRETEHFEIFYARELETEIERHRCGL